MCFVGEAVTVKLGRGLSFPVGAEDHRIFLPPPPSCIVTLNTVVSHGDGTGRTYKADDFKPELERLGVFEHVEVFGAFHTNHVWILNAANIGRKARFASRKKPGTLRASSVLSLIGATPKFA